MANQSGTSDIPSLLAYPSILKVEEFAGIKNFYCYILDHYGNEGIACFIFRDGEKINVQVGDWAGQIQDLDNKNNPKSEVCKIFVIENVGKLLDLMKMARITQAIFYVTINADRKFLLVDVRVAYNKFLGPGMLRDVFGKLIETPKVLAIEHITDEVHDALMKGTGTFSGNLMLKPSRFRVVDWNGAPNPLYVEVIR